MKSSNHFVFIYIHHDSPLLAACPADSKTSPRPPGLPSRSGLTSRSPWQSWASRRWETSASYLDGRPTTLITRTSTTHAWRWRWFAGTTSKKWLRTSRRFICIVWLGMTETSSFVCFVCTIPPGFDICPGFVLVSTESTTRTLEGTIGQRLERDWFWKTYTHLYCSERDETSIFYASYLLINK